MVNSIEGVWRGTQAGRTKMMLRLVVIVGAVGLAPAVLRVMLPAMLTVAEVLLGIGQACLTFLRASGV
jgi:hypothetical protein